MAPNRYFRTRATVEDATAALKASEQRQPHKAAVPMAKRTNRPPPQRSSRATAVANQRFRPRTTPSKVYRAPGQAAPHSMGMARGTKRPRPSSSSGAAGGSGGAGSSSSSGGGSLASLLGPARKHKTTVRHCLQGTAHPNPTQRFECTHTQCGVCVWRCQVRDVSTAQALMAKRNQAKGAHGASSRTKAASAKSAAKPKATSAKAAAAASGTVRALFAPGIFSSSSTNVTQAARCVMSSCFVCVCVFGACIVCRVEVQLQVA